MTVFLLNWSKKNGFEAVWASSFEISVSHCVKDESVLSMDEFLHHAKDINEATSLPVILDADTGYGDYSDLMRAVRKIEALGISAICIEDQKSPKQNSLLCDSNKTLAPIDEFIGKIKAAKSSKISKDFKVFARVEALVVGLGIEEALKRAAAYSDAGADGILVHSKSESPKEIISFINGWNLDVPLILVPTTYKLTLKEIKDFEKVKIVIFANHGIRAAIKSMDANLRKLSETGDIRSIEDNIASLDEVFKLEEKWQK